jgi:hypothetical protein
MKFKVFEPECENVPGGWTKIGYVEANDEKEALILAKKKYNDKVMVQKVKKALDK